MQQNNKIPYGWEVEKLGKLCKTFSGGTPSIDKPEYYNGNIPFIRSGEIHSNETELFLTDLGLKNSSAKIIEKGDLLVALYGATSGEVSISKISGAINQALLCIKSNKFDNVYLKHLLLNKKTKIINKYLQGGQGNLSAEIIKSIKFAVPPLSEQKKIAEILSSWDNVIELLDRQIDLKNQQKKYLMQTLLTGDIRLSGFTAPWDEVKLGDICKIKKGKQLSNLDMFEFGKYPVLNGGQDFSGYTDKFNAEKNTIAISEGGNSCGFVSYIISDFWSGGHCYTIETKINKLFSYYILKFNEINIMRLRVGSGLPNIQKSTLEKFKIKIPTDIKEQEKIAEILTLADDEIFLLKKKKELIKQQKQYLMQTLLTGQIRV